MPYCKDSPGIPQILGALPFLSFNSSGNFRLSGLVGGISGSRAGSLYEVLWWLHGGSDKQIRIIVLRVNYLSLLVTQ